MKGANPLQCLEQRAPPYRDPVLHFHAPRPIALRGGDRNEEAPAKTNERRKPMRRACALALSPMQACAAEAPHVAQIQSALRTGLMAPAWRLLHVTRTETLDLS